MATPEELLAGLARVMTRAGLAAPEQLTRLTGGATMESWRFTSGSSDYVLRRAPSLEYIAERPYGHDVEADVIRAAHAAHPRPAVPVDAHQLSAVAPGGAVRGRHAGGGADPLPLRRHGAAAAARVGRAGAGAGCREWRQPLHHH